MAGGPGNFGNIKKKGDFKKKLNKWFSAKLFPVMAKLANQTHLSAIRDGFAIVIPLIIASAMGLVLRTTIFGGGNTETSSLLGVFASWDGSAFKAADGALTEWGRASDVMDKVLSSIGKFGLDFIALYFAFAFGYFLSRARGNNAPEIAGVVSLGSFLILTLGGQSSAFFVAADGSTKPLVSTLFDSKGLFTSIITTIISIEYYSWLSKIKALQVNMPAGVPPAVARSFSKLIPIILTSLSMALLLAVVAIPTYITQAAMLTSQNVGTGSAASTVIGVSPAASGSFYNFGDLLYMGVQAPFIYAATIQGANLGITILMLLLASFLWFFGLHGSAVATGIFGPVLITLLTRNAEMLQLYGLQYLKDNGTIFVYWTINYFTLAGGHGATLMLLVATLAFGKNPTEVAVSRFALPPGIFNINEPVVFGFPLVTNVKWIIPYTLVPPINAVSTYLLYLAFNTTPTFAQVPYTLPAGVGALFATGFDYTSFFIVVVNLAISFLFWGSFVLISNRLYRLEQRKKAIEPAPASVSPSEVEAITLAAAPSGEAIVTDPVQLDKKQPTVKSKRSATSKKAGG